MLNNRLRKHAADYRGARDAGARPHRRQPGADVGPRPTRRHPVLTAELAGQYGRWRPAGSLCRGRGVDKGH